MIRVCQIVGNMNGGGVESVVMNYYRHIDRSKVQFDFIVTENSSIIPRQEMEDLGGRVFIVPAYTKLSQFKKACYDLFCEHKEWQIVHAHMNSLNVFPLKEAERAGIPVRISHSHSTAGKGEPIKNIAKTFLKPFANKYPTERFACSKYAGQWLFRKDAHFEIVYNAIDLLEYYFSAPIRTKVRSNLGIDNDQVVIGHVGRFMPQKNQSFLIESFAQTCKVRNDIVLLCVGSGDDEPKIKEMASELGIKNKVKFLGQRNDVNELYQAFDVFVLPSLYEGLGIVAVEAQAAGLPCLLSRTVTTEVDVTNTCKFLPIDDPQVWVNEFCNTKVRSDKERAQINKNDFVNYDIVRQGNWLTNKYEKLYKEVNS